MIATLGHTMFREIAHNLLAVVDRIFFPSLTSKSTAPLLFHDHDHEKVFIECLCIRNGWVDMSTVSVGRRSMQFG
jgi:hypothetical protein